MTEETTKDEPPTEDPAVVATVDAPPEPPPTEEYVDPRAEKMARLSASYDREDEAEATNGGQPQKTVEQPDPAPVETPPEPPVGDPPADPEPIAAETTIKVAGEEKQLTLEELQAEAQKKIAADQAFRAAADQKKQNDERDAALNAREQAILQREAELAQASQPPLPSDAGATPVDAVDLARRALIDEDPAAVELYNALQTPQPPTNAPAAAQVDENAIVQRAQEAAQQAAQQTYAEQQWQADLTRGNTEVYANEANAEFLALPGAVQAVNQAFNDLTTVEPGQSADYYVKRSAELVRTDFETKLGRKFGAEQPLPAMEQRRQQAQQHAGAVVSTSQGARAVGGEQRPPTTDELRDKLRAGRVGRASA